jgi:hypothetical protein
VLRSSGRRIRTSTDEESLDPSQALSDQDAIDSGRISGTPEMPADRSDTLRMIEGRRVEREVAVGAGTINRIEAALKEAVRACGTEQDVRALRRALLDALRQLEQQCGDE